MGNRKQEKQGTRDIKHQKKREQEKRELTNHQLKNQSKCK
jgi:hypothetical protein